MDIIMEPENLAVIEEMLCKYLNLPIETHFSIENLFSEKHNNAELIHFSVVDPSGTILPRKLILKTSQNSPREVLFYQASLPSAENLPVARCLGCEHNLQTGQFQVLMEDLTLTHSNLCDWPAPLPLQAGFALVEALAELHAAFWASPVLDEQTFPLPDFLQNETSYQVHTGYLKRDFEIYAAGMGGSLEISQLRIYSEVLNFLPDLWQTFWKPRLSNGPLPLIHGDLNPCNILYPNHPSGKVTLIDWEACRRDQPATDLVMLFGLHLCPEFEDVHPFLLHYHQHLTRFGIKDYSFNDLLSDYEIALLFEIFNPLKLYAHQGILDECMIQNSITALNSIQEARY
jgi:aminoglycoside phosphotransferase (APT) family kinase protein